MTIVEATINLKAVIEELKRHGAIGINYTANGETSIQIFSQSDFDAIPGDASRRPHSGAYLYEYTKVVSGVRFCLLTK